MGFASDLYIGNALVDVRARFGVLTKAWNVFEEMARRDLVPWNIMISGCSANGEWEEALQIYREFNMVGLNAGSSTLSRVLPANGGLLEVIRGLCEKMGMNADLIVNNCVLSSIDWWTQKGVTRDTASGGTS